VGLQIFSLISILDKDKGVLFSYTASSYLQGSISPCWGLDLSMRTSKDDIEEQGLGLYIVMTLSIHAWAGRLVQRLVHSYDVKTRPHYPGCPKERRGVELDGRPPDSGRRG
jgi:hypothetical protein